MSRRSTVRARKSLARRLRFTRQPRHVRTARAAPQSGRPQNVSLVGNLSDSLVAGGARALRSIPSTNSVMILPASTGTCSLDRSPAEPERAIRPGHGGHRNAPPSVAFMQFPPLDERHLTGLSQQFDTQPYLQVYGRLPPPRPAEQRSSAEARSARVRQAPLDDAERRTQRPRALPRGGSPARWSAQTMTAESAQPVRCALRLAKPDEHVTFHEACEDRPAVRRCTPRAPWRRWC